MTDDPLDLRTPLARFQDWVRSSKGGDIYVYAMRNSLDTKTPEDIRAVALEARNAFARGHIELVQRRTNGHCSPFDYLAIKRKQRRTPTVFGDPWQPKILSPNRFVRWQD